LQKRKEQISLAIPQTHTPRVPRRHAASQCAGVACDHPKPETSIVVARLHRWLPPVQAWCLGGREAMTMRRGTRALCTLALLCVAAHFQGASCRSGRGGARGRGGASFGRKSGGGGGGGSGGRRGGAGGGSGSARTAAASGPSNINGRRGGWRERRPWWSVEGGGR